MRVEAAFWCWSCLCPLLQWKLHFIHSMFIFSSCSCNFSVTVSSKKNLHSWWSCTFSDSFILLEVSVRVGVRHTYVMCMLKCQCHVNEVSMSVAGKVLSWSKVVSYYLWYSVCWCPCPGDVTNSKVTTHLFRFIENKTTSWLRGWASMPKKEVYKYITSHEHWNRSHHHPQLFQIQNLFRP